MHTVVLVYNNGSKLQVDARIVELIANFMCMTESNTQFSKKYINTNLWKWIKVQITNVTCAKGHSKEIKY